MGAVESSNPTVVIRLGGVATSPPNTLELIRGRSCFRASNGDWFKALLPGDGESVRIIEARKLFEHGEPPGLERVRFLPVMSGTELNEDERASSLFPLLNSSARQHFDVGDFLSAGNVDFVVVDVMPNGGGLLTKQSSIHLEGSSVQYAHRVRIAPMHHHVMESERSHVKEFLARVAGNFYIKHKQTFQDDSGTEWAVIEIDGSTVGESGRVLHPSAFVAIGGVPEIGLTTECLHCYRFVTSPSPGFEAFAFACPHCGFLVANPMYSVWRDADIARSCPAKDLILRLKLALSDIRASDPRTIILETLISRLPRTLEGRLEWRSLNEVARRIVQAPIENLKSTPPEIINLLPISKFTKSENEDDRCEICLDTYLQGVELRTLPCFHRFHVKCCDNWLSLSKSCPLCKIAVDSNELELPL